MGRALLAVALVAIATACVDLPGLRPSYRVAAVEPRASYLATRLEWTDSPLAPWSSDRLLSLLFPATDVCRQVLAQDALVAYAPSGWEGTAHRGDASCRAVGFFDLASWRDRHARPLVNPPVPREQATFELIYRDAETALLRGRFPLLARVGWAGGWDSVALVRPGGACDEAVGAGVASIEYRAQGPNAVALVGASGLCPIEGVARP